MGPSHRGTCAQRAAVATYAGRSGEHRTKPVVGIGLHLDILYIVILAELHSDGLVKRVVSRAKTFESGVIYIRSVCA